jgi:hypothetical protein
MYRLSLAQIPRGRSLPYSHAPMGAPALSSAPGTGRLHGSGPSPACTRYLTELGPYLLPNREIEPWAAAMPNDRDGGVPSRTRNLKHGARRWRSRSQPLGQRRIRRVPKVAPKRQPEAEKQTELAGLNKPTLPQG